MKRISMLNDVLGPIMRGPSSGHTAGPYHIGRLARALLGDEPASVTFAFDPSSSFAATYHQQGSDLGFATGVMGWAITDERFPQALDLAPSQGVHIRFVVEPLADADHPNHVEIRMTSRGGRSLTVTADSVGGGAVVITRLDGWPVRLTGEAHEVLAVLESSAEPTVRELVTHDGLAIGAPERQARGDRVLWHVRRASPLGALPEARLKELSGVQRVWTAPPVFLLVRGDPLFSNAAEMVALAEERGCSLGRIALVYEAALLGLPERDVLAEVARRYEVMRAAVHQGLEKDSFPMALLQPSARSIYQAEAEGRLAMGGIHTRAAARALAVMHVNAVKGVICAAPTAGSAGVVPGVVVTLAEERDLTEEQTCLALLAASAAGLIVAMRATFTASVAGCQVEIGASQAMAAAAVVEAAGGSARQAADAAAIALHNMMGLICDPVCGMVEIPCHTRNAAAASGAFVCADLILGGYANPIPLDETVDAVYSVGQMMPREFRCTALGGLATTPSALAMHQVRG